MKKYNLEITRKNGNVRTVAVYLDDTTAKLLEEAGDRKLLDEYLYEEYKYSRRARQEGWWNHSLDADVENGLDYEDEHIYMDFSFGDLEDEDLQEAIERLTPRQQEFLKLMYIDGWTQKDIAEKFGIDKRSVSDAIGRIYASLQKNYKKK